MFMPKLQAFALMYHDVCSGNEASGFEGPDAQLYKITPARFEQHLHALAESDRDVTVVKEWDQRSFATFLTFDDGGSSAMRAAEMLEVKGWRGHFFVTTEKIGSRGFLTKGQIAELFRRGHVMGSHSHSHPLRMSRLTEEQIYDEWGRSSDILSEILGSRVDVASIPGGMYSKQVARLASSSGIEYLFTSEPRISSIRIDSSLILGRFSINSRTAASDVSALARLRVRPRIYESFVWNAKKPLKLLGGEHFLKLRKWVFAKIG